MNLKIYTTAFFACLTIACAYAQTNNWEPFPENQVSLWSLADGRSEIYYNDFRVPMGSPRTAIGMGHNYYNTPEMDNCLDSAYALLRSQPQTTPSHPTTKRTEMMFAWDAGHWTFEEQNKELFFYPLANVGDSWGFSTLQGTGGYDSIRIICMQKHQGIVFGQPDSLKTFAVQPYLAGNLYSNTWTFRLSKRFGLLRFVPFKEILLGNQLDYWELRGADPVGPDRFGFTSHFMDYFGRFSPGDVYKWHYRYDSPIGPNGSQSDRFWRDSLISVVYSPAQDRVELTLQRTQQSVTHYNNNNSWVYTPLSTSIEQTIYKVDSVMPFFQKPDSVLYLAGGRINSALSFARLLEGDVRRNRCGDTTLHTSLLAYYKVDSSCTFNLNPDRTIDQYIAPGLGFVETSGFSLYGTDSERMVGYRKSSGLNCGDYSSLRLLGIENSEKTSLRLLNTIANETLWVENKTSQNFSYRLVDIMGSVLQVGTSSDEAFALSVGHLAAGMYFIQLESDGQRTVQKFSLVR